MRPSAEIQIGLNLEQMGKRRGGGGAARSAEAAAPRRHRGDHGARQRSALAQEATPRRPRSTTKAIERIGTPDRSHWSLFYFRGTAYERAKQWAKAEADLKKALELVPDDQPTAKGAGAELPRLFLGRHRTSTSTRPSRCCSAPSRSRPRDGMIIDSLGWAYYRLGRYDEAVRELEKAIELKPGDPVINDHLGDAYWKVGRQLEARFQWQHAKDFEPRARGPAEDRQEARARHRGNPESRKRASRRAAADPPLPACGERALRRRAKSEPEGRG